MVDKLVRDGKVAVLYSPGFGAGWSTWGDDGQFMVFDRGLVELAERRAPEAEVEAYILTKFPDSPYMGGWDGVQIEWLPIGTSFDVNEYDGSESIRTNPLRYTA